METNTNPAAGSIPPGGGGTPAASPAVGGVAGSATSPVAAGHGYTSGCPCEKCVAQRKKWTEKYHRKKAQLSGQPLPPPVPPSEDPTGHTAPPVPAPAPVLWNSSDLDCLAETLVSEAEKFSKATLTDKAARLSPDLATEVARDAGWNPVAKKAICTTFPRVTAKGLNKVGIGAENSDLVVLAGALVSISLGHLRLSQKLDAMLEKQSAEKQARENPEKPASV